MKTVVHVFALMLLWASPVLAETHYHVQVDGISCPFCLYGIEKRLGKLEGVTEVASEIKEGRFFIKMAEGKTLSEQAVAEAVRSAGFTLRSFEEVRLGESQ